MVDIEFQILSTHLHALTKSPYIQILFWLIMFDIMSGYIKAFKLKQFDSKTSTNGLLRHILVFSVVTFTALYARALGHREIGITTCLFFTMSYVGSLLENWEALGLPFPDALKPYINQMRKQQEKKIKKYLNKKEDE
ncbi:phage holin family protein [Granulicatella adiacens]|uniref:phage holin family protein n=1 Tax=Granulicatella adiacens TaxID=46124 RepID=UPI003C6FA928